MVECPKCGNIVEKTDKRCSKCGEPLKKSQSNKIIAIIAIVAVIAIVGVLASGMLSGDANADSNTVSPITDDDSSSQPTEYWASAKAEKFHLPTCEWAQKISDDNKIVYHSREDAIKDGRIPCGKCNP